MTYRNGNPRKAPEKTPTTPVTAPQPSVGASAVEALIYDTLSKMLSGNAATPEPPKPDLPVVPEFVPPAPNPIVRSNITPTGKGVYTWTDGRF